MDYVVGSIAALISGNVTPSRPKLLRRALTPTKHQASPNVTPKSELVEDRSIFLSPTLQKKKAIIKKSPKRIFQNNDIDATDGEESSRSSPKADKVKKHLKDDLDADDTGNSTVKSPDSKFNKSPDNVSMKKGKRDSIAEEIREINESTPKKKKKQQVSSNVEHKVLNTKSIVNDIPADDVTKSPKKKNKNKKTANNTENVAIEITTTEDTSESNTGNQGKSPKKKNKKNKSLANATDSMEIDEQTTTEQKNPEITNKSPKKKNKQKNKTESTEISEEKQESQAETNQNTKKKNKKRKKKVKKNQSKPETDQVETEKIEENQEESTEDTENEVKKRTNYVNPNAITEQDTDSEHESDDEIESENEEINKEVLDTTNTEPAEDSSDEEEEKKSQKPEKKKEIKEREVATEDEVKRTIFVGNVPFSGKCKKEIKKIFSKHGPIETVRIRTIPVKDARVTPKLAVIKNELHPERSTVNVYVKFRDEVCVENALLENNVVLNGNHLRVTRSSSSGAEHDPARSVFVGNLPFALEDDTFREKFSNCGEIHSVRIIRDKKTNAGKGFGYVNFASKDGVELALALSEEDLTIKNRILRVKRCTPSQKQKPQTHQQFKQQRQQNRPQQNRPFQQGRNVQSGGFNKFGNQGNQRGGFNKFGGKPGQFGGKPGQFGGKPGQFGNKPGQEDVGASRRIQNKRKYQEGNGEGPPNKRQKDINQPIKEKKTRKEFVGMTAEKKKKNKFDKGQKKKKALSEILTK